MKYLTRKVQKGSDDLWEMVSIEARSDQEEKEPRERKRKETDVTEKQSRTPSQARRTVGMIYEKLKYTMINVRNK